ncbi:MAG: type II secretion system protein GspJ [Gammaproteobacteria bacterium]|nr:MAG: type II secretion system protein GspJ [Gammaproteobacteria bacterium]
MKQNNDGFTLIELMVALAIFSILAAAAYSALNTILFQKNKTALIATTLMSLQNAHRIVSADLFTVVNRKINDEYDTEQPAFVSNKADNIIMEFSRAGVVNPVIQNSQIQRAVYLYEDENIYRILYSKADRIDNTTKRKRLLLSGVKELKVEFLLDSEGKSKSTTFPHYSKKIDYPAGIKISFEIDGFDKLEWLWNI